jgi:hypothetical protein
VDGVDVVDGVDKVASSALALAESPCRPFALLDIGAFAA